MVNFSNYHFSGRNYLSFAHAISAAWFELRNCIGQTIEVPEGFIVFDPIHREKGVGQYDPKGSQKGSPRIGKHWPGRTIVRVGVSKYWEPAYVKETRCGEYFIIEPVKEDRAYRMVERNTLLSESSKGRYLHLNDENSLWIKHSPRNDRDVESL